MSSSSSSSSSSSLSLCFLDKYDRGRGDSNGARGEFLVSLRAVVSLLDARRGSSVVVGSLSSLTEAGNERRTVFVVRDVDLIETGPLASLRRTLFDTITPARHTVTQLCYNTHAAGCYLVVLDQGVLAIRAAMRTALAAYIQPVRMLFVCESELHRGCRSDDVRSLSCLLSVVASDSLIL